MLKTTTTKVLFVTLMILLFNNITGNASNWSWARRAGGSGNEAGYSSATDNSNNSIVTGGFTSACLVAGSTKLYNAGQADIFIIKYTPTGSIQWAKGFGSNRNEEAYSVACDGSGNIYLTGYFISDTLSFDGFSVINTSPGYADIFVAKLNPAGDVLWVRNAGGLYHDEAYCITADGSGNAYISGYFSGSEMSFGASTLINSSPDFYDFFVAKYDPSGNFQWVSGAQGDYSESGYGIQADGAGNIVVSGSFNSTTLTFDTIVLTNNGYANIFLAKYNSSGNVLWARQAGGTGTDEAYDIAVTPNNQVCLTGYFSSPAITFGSTVLTNSSAGVSDVFLVKYTPNGMALWATRAGGSANEAGYGITCDNSGNIIIGGSFSSDSIIFGNTTLTNTGGGDAFLVKYNASGQVLQAIGAGGNGYDLITGVSHDNSGNINFAGYFTGADFAAGNSTLTNSGPGYSDVLSGAVTAAGAVLWAKKTSGSGIEEAYDISTDQDGNIYMAGYFGSQDITFGNYQLTNDSTSGNDIFITKLDSTGMVVWADSAGGAGNEAAYKIAIDNAGNVYVTGGFTSTSIRFGNDTLVNQGFADIFVTKYAPNGSVLWAKEFGGPSYDEAYAIDVDDNGNVYLSGYFYSSTLSFGPYSVQNTNSLYSEVFLVKLDAGGTPLWAKSFGGTSYDAAYSLTIDSQNNVYVTGGFSSSSLIVEGTPLVNQGNSDIFLIKYASQGSLAWAKSFGSTGFEEGLAVKTDPAGDPVLTGYFSSSTLSINNVSLTNAGIGTNDMYLAKFTSDGNIEWLIGEGDSGNESGTGICIDPQGSIFVCGGFDSPSPQIAGTVLNNAGSGDGFVARYSANGSSLWAKSFGGEGLETTYGITGDENNNMYITGSFGSDTLAFGNTTLYNAGYYDVFVANLHADNWAGIGHFEQDNMITVYPNPSSGDAEIIFPENTLSIRIYNAEGKPVLEEKLSGRVSSKKINLPKSGLYLISLTMENGVITRKLVVVSKD